GRFGSAVQLDGSSGYLNLGLADPVNPPSFTISAWIRQDSAQGARTVLSTHGDGPQGLQITLQDGRPSTTLWAENPSESFTAGGGAPLAEGGWHHIAATFDGAALTMYADGAFRDSVQARFRPNEMGSARLGKEARSGGAQFFSGAMDEFRVLNYAQDWQAILRQYRKGWGAQYSTDAGKSWAAVPDSALSYNGAIEGNPGPFSITAGPLPLAESTSTNRVLFYAEDVAGHLSTTSITVMTPNADVTGPILESAQVSDNGSSWYPQGSTLAGATVSIRAEIRDPFASLSRTIGLKLSTDPARPELISGTKALLHFEDAGATAVDSSGNGADFHLNGGSWVPGRFGNAVSLNGSSDFLNISPGPAGKVDPPRFTLSVWIRPGNPESTAAILSTWGGTAGYHSYISGGQVYALAG
ncbi:MAG: LamG domain-containing protein, partial [Chloroflexota bacterium]